MFSVGPQKYLMLAVLNAVMFGFQQNTVEACTGTVITGCNDTTSCIQTYEEVYKSLASSMNYFKIAQAIYPAKKMSSLLVHVTLNGANGTEKCCPAYYTWSMSCLFAAFPGHVLEVLSLGSILVRSRTQTLNITIAPFCCNVSVENRVTIMENVLAALQDLAVSPGIQNPSLNTAECVTEGHEPNLADTERELYIIATMLLSFSFAVFLGPWLAIYTLAFLDKVKPKDSAMYSALVVVLSLMLIGELGLFVTSIVFLCRSDAPALLKGLMLSFLIITFLKGPIVGCIWFIKNESNLNEWKSKDQLFKQILKKIPPIVSIFLWAYLTLYHFCWMVTGIMVHALWSVTVLLFVGVIISALFFALQFFFKFCYDSNNQLRNFFIILYCLTLFFPFVFLIFLVIAAGQRVFVSNTIDDVVKTIILTVTIAFMKRILFATEDTPENSNDIKSEDINSVTIAFMKRILFATEDTPENSNDKKSEEEAGNKGVMPAKTTGKEEEKRNGQNEGGEGESVPLLTQTEAKKQAEMIKPINHDGV